MLRTFLLILWCGKTSCVWFCFLPYTIRRNALGLRIRAEKNTGILRVLARAQGLRMTSFRLMRLFALPKTQ
jgi:hypothetical protein